MKGVAGIISAIVLVVILALTVVTMAYLMDTTYGQQQAVESYINKFLSSPKAFQVDPSTITSDGPLEIKYVIYPNGQIESVSLPFEGRADLSNLLDGNPWVYVVLSNGQTFNISQSQISISSTISLLSLESQVPYYADYP